MMGRRARRIDVRSGFQGGYTLIEVLVTLIILLIGLLGLAGMLVTVQQGEVEAYQRKQALILLEDMIDRLNANHEAAPCYAFTTDSANGSPALGTGYGGGAIVCGSGSATQQARATEDLQTWNDALLGISEKKGTANVGAIIDARGCITSPSSGVYTVTVAWRGLSRTAAPPAALGCGRNQYLDAAGAADEKLRRVISVTIRIANLKA